jgi:hypothetical protein
MAKSPEQVLANYCQHAERSKQGFDSARAASNPDLAASNLGQGLKAYLMQGLIGWRCGITSPVNSFRGGMGFVRQGYSTWQTMNGSSTARTLHLPLEKTAFVAFLVNENPIAFDLHELVADRLLDANLGQGLQGEWDEEAWTSGLEQLRQVKGSTLAVESYTAYHRLLRSSQDGDVKATVEKAVSLFEKRKSNGFYSAGEQTDGGGNYNAITVDYRLAAIMKKIDYKSDSIHSWKWG